MPYPLAARRYPCLAVLLALTAGVAQAQSSNDSPNQFGDRQLGSFGDPGHGYFGNPAAGDFDKNAIKAPPPGVRPMGRVYNNKPPETPPYVTLPAPVEATPAVPPATKKPARKRASHHHAARDE